MKYLRCALVVALMALVLPCQSYGGELSLKVGDGVSKHVVKSNSTTKPTRHFELCLGYRPDIYVTVYRDAGSQLCLYKGPRVQRMANEFVRIQARIQRAKWLASLTQCAKDVAENYVAVGQRKRLMAAPMRVKRVICAANEIDGFPYSWGGGHNTEFVPSEDEETGTIGYDCSGSVSYALHGGGFIGTPTDSSGLTGWGEEGAGRWITVYANSEHVWMVVAGVRFDTRDDPGDETGPRWHSSGSSPDEFFVRHPEGF